MSLRQDPAEEGLSRNQGRVSVLERVVPHDMTRFSDLADNAGKSLRLLPDEEEGCRNAQFRQEVQQPRGVFRVWTVVEGQTNSTTVGRSMRHEQPPGDAAPIPFLTIRRKKEARADRLIESKPFMMEDFGSGHTNRGS